MACEASSLYAHEGDHIQMIFTKQGMKAQAILKSYIPFEAMRKTKKPLLKSEIRAFDAIVIQDKKDENLQPAIHLYVNQALIKIPYKEEGYLFVNIFDYIDFDLSQPKGTIQLLLNGEKAAVTDPVQSGDKIEIYWKK
ncbi:MAG: hypothetical protein RR448_11935 [Niameybacter sp.]|uniref:hypothetical protein n=1 Tax=Niameybacter sp. TaxID=2033640 RepID=UPI002FC754ED